MKEEKWKESLQDAEVVIEHDCSNPDDKLKVGEQLMFVKSKACHFISSHHRCIL
jgi:hypothetical protein